ncbi:PD-(D/E)XK nuclease-like domain-containing protein [Shewanella sp. BJSY2023SW005]|uniref:PD-(D/E)XK nuclease-like domain-containing protein n=1 Tax=Shewanella sp. BJSY2023SW005 TaxID=3392043 RepID=UPI0039B52D74
MQFKLTFEPMAAARKARGLVSISYIVEADTRVKAELMAIANLESEGYVRTDFKRAIKCTEVAPEPAPEPQPDETELPAAAVADKSNVDQEAANDDDPFAAFVVNWTIESLNDRLEHLAPGERLVIDGLPDDIYHGSNGISCSKLKLFLECPQKYKAKYIDGMIPDAEKSYFDFGKAAHCMVLEPWAFSERYICQPDEIKVRRGKAWDDVKAQADNGGQVVLTRQQWEDMPLLRQSLESNKTALALSTGGVSERSIFKRDEETGLIIKCRPDYTIGGLIVDLKTSDTAEPRFFGAKAKRLGYHIQDAMYSDISECNEFCFFVIESARPFVITAPVIMDDKTKRLGYLKYRKALREIKQCMSTGEWPAYTDETTYVELNSWEQSELDDLEAQFDGVNAYGDAA